MKKINKIISLILIIISVAMCSLFGCDVSNDTKIKPSGTPYNNKDEDHRYLVGIGETCVELWKSDGALTTEWISHNVKAMGFKTFRIWVTISDFIIVNRDDSVEMNEYYANKLENFITKIKDAGVEKIAILTGARLHLFEDRKYGDLCVPDPTVEPDRYLRLLKVEEKAYELIARRFPQINYYESINELDGTGSVAKNGFIFNVNGIDGFEDYVFTDEEKIKVAMDLNWYIRRGIKKGNKNAKMLLPSLCHFKTAVDYLDEIYQTILSGALPMGEELSDTDPDNYFDALNWHPYANGLFGMSTEVDDERWIQRQRDFYNVAIKYGDEEKPVWYTEFGYSDAGEGTMIGSVTKDGQEGVEPTNVIKVLEVIKRELPFVETVNFFRMTDLYSSEVSEAPAENTFGLFYNPNDPGTEQAPKWGKPKPSAVALARYNKGKLTYNDMKELCKYYYDKMGDIPEEYKCVIE